MTEILQSKNAITILRGESKTLKLTVTNPDSTPLNLTGGRIVFTVKGNALDAIPLLQKTTDNSSQALITSATGGLAEIYMIPGDTKTLSIKEYVFDVWLILGGKQYPIVPPSTLNLQPGVTTL
jgi:hypothetical protein